MPRMLPFVAGLALCVSSVSVYAQATHINFTQTVSFSAVVENPCNSEPVAYTIEGRQSQRTTFPPGGTTIHEIAHFEVHGTGTGLITGDSYIVNQTFLHSVQDSNAELFHERIVLRLTAKGPGPGAQLVLIFKMVRNPNGETIIDLEFESAECRGEN